jgi:D-arabinose 1-dehydrogenase-like Zn-dependent alcohol dehydrogenase
VECKLEKKQAGWEKLASRWKISSLNTIINEITLDEIKTAYEHLLSGKAVGRYVVKIKE